MKKIYNYSLRLLVILLSSGCYLQAQEPTSLTFQGLLEDIQGNPISNDIFELAVQVLSIPDDTTLWDHVTKVESDDRGYITFFIPSTDHFFSENIAAKESVSLHLGFFPISETVWMKPGEDFMVSYTLSAIPGGDTLSYQMRRMEGSDLTRFAGHDIQAFKDEYPFAYLKGSFAITTHPGDTLIEDLSNWLNPEVSEEEEAGSRGLKGGFAVGGYRKNK